MKKVLSLVLAVMLLVSALSMTASAADYTNYLYVKNTDRTIEQAQISHFIDGSLITPGQLYTVTVVYQAQKVMPFGGHAFVSCYSYKSYNPDNFDGLGTWKDFAVVGSGTQRWTEMSYEYTADEPTDKVLISLGFYKALGTIAIAELTFKGPDGTVIYEADFSKGLNKEEWVVTMAKEGVVFEYGVEGATEAPAEPTPEPTAEPTPEPTAEPTPEPTAEPTPEPTAAPTATPTTAPTKAPEPTKAPVVDNPNSGDFATIAFVALAIAAAGVLLVSMKKREA
ncbi:MAG: hypothetical protein E7491_02040 [Ruminococcaceae bacterium]|nr:hypothetical protein [Oscillospiraceae bacterium]